ncbi:hypothetical protein F442_04533 [Phytophthora nicotianae P10297]|nr:hypothetical protein PPTG_08816 [Phytophthora nicotianae INRA-310]ETK92225.1 hypothetical protein L915_04369 [Phytophthora nicotianae]ETN12755.1 hypothetical protein PPTG_08816 [Phytophthora nicotianae INRA-310]ETP50070.1 hypothetical protein F442_04533 [Phytophthora nicotianae P10297]
MENEPDKLAVSTAILAAVSASSLASNTQPNADESSEPKREFGTVAYERVLPEGDCHCVERTVKKLQSLDNFVHLWVRDARTFRHGIESSVPYFSLRVSASIPVNELRNLVQKQFTLLSSYRKEVDGELQLCFDDQTLDDEETFSAYLPTTISAEKPGTNNSTKYRQPSWPRPHTELNSSYTGILWVLPWRPSRKKPLQWGDGGDPKFKTGQDQTLQ